MEKVELAGALAPLWDSRGSLPIFGTPRTGFSAGNELNLWDSTGSLGQNRQLENVKKPGSPNALFWITPRIPREMNAFARISPRYGMVV
jgi:hypothetical protein